jgi:hypothetical protein
MSAHADTNTSREQDHEQGEARARNARPTGEANGALRFSHNFYGTDPDQDDRRTRAREAIASMKRNGRPPGDTIARTAAPEGSRALLRATGDRAPSKARSTARDDCDPNRCSDPAPMRNPGSSCDDAS